MAGHSKWANIKRQKARVDARKGSLFTKLSRAIIVAARSGLPDPEANFRLRSAVEKAKAAGMPAENIERAIAKGSGNWADDSPLEEIRYEGYGPGGVAVLIEAMTDNRNRTAAEVREAFSKVGGSLGESGCVSWLFRQKGVISLEGVTDPEALLLAVAEAGGEDLKVEGTAAEVYCDYTLLEQVATSLKKEGYQVQEAAIRWIPSTEVHVEDPETAKLVLTLMERLDHLDDVQNVYANFEIDEALMESLA
ncbi:transcriptional regulator [Synechococcus sp. 65AY6A5]|uniref:YebC/PmpR family DNA-binding transcriptional regulator n=1 Tax=Synechococcus sp. 65AY6A5 TaxID=1353265 RepID=UPI000C18ABD4|nr:YebC/PmpR family DNA-binding transcriptional regulator [Synechococcus sp. 65AY6A5]PIK87669.1 transcriptional regulator [Synechococcus sp. 65AY6A5]